MSVYLFSTQVLVGTTRTIADGTFAAVFDIPDGLETGKHTLQLSGLSISGVVRTASVAVLVQEKQVPTSTFSSQIQRLGAGIALVTSLLFLIWRKRRKRD